MSWLSRDSLILCRDSSIPILNVINHWSRVTNMQTLKILVTISDVAILRNHVQHHS